LKSLQSNPEPVKRADGKAPAEPMDPSLPELAAEVFETLAERFPVACASDEFYYFPQAVAESGRWNRWDRLTPESVAETAGRLSSWETALARRENEAGSYAEKVDAAALRRHCRGLREQLTEFRAWARQPSFSLTLAAVGLAEALEADDPAAAHRRADTLADFFGRSRRHLSDVPAAFLSVGREMVPSVRGYLVGLLDRLPELSPAINALHRFDARLRDITPAEVGIGPTAGFERILADHLGTGLSVAEADDLLRLEIAETVGTLESEAGRVAPGAADWRTAMETIPRPAIGPGGLVSLYRGAVADLERHCQTVGLVSPETAAACPVRVAPVPDYLSAVRTASAYAIPPGHPPTGGTFYVIGADDPAEAARGYHREYRILTAHETYPGHHLLDISRWANPRSLRRPLERPLFYEGWACFAESMVVETGFLDRPADRMLLARRRLWRAVRGRVDLGLNAGTMTPAEAVEALVETGTDPDAAAAAVRKYPLNPGYQVCYTVGLRRFAGLFRQYGENDVAGFARRVLREGEIGFDLMTAVLRRAASRKG
jgi:hypothetical protein